MQKRPQITPREFAKAIESQPIATIPFDSKMFGTAADNGQMIAQIRPGTAPPRCSCRWRNG